MKNYLVIDLDGVNKPTYKNSAQVIDLELYKELIINSKPKTFEKQASFTKGILPKQYYEISKFLEKENPILKKLSKNSQISEETPYIYQNAANDETAEPEFEPVQIIPFEIVNEEKSFETEMPQRSSLQSILYSTYPIIHYDPISSHNSHYNGGLEKNLRNYQKYNKYIHKPAANDISYNQNPLCRLSYYRR